MDKLKKYKKIVVAITVFIIQLLFFSILFSNKNANSFIVNHIIFPLNNFISLFTNFINFPVGEIFYLIIFFLIVLKLLFIITYSIKGNKIKIKSNFYSLLVIINGLYFVYMFAWGIMYKKDTLTFDRETIHINPNELKKIYCNEMQKSIIARSQINYQGHDTLQFQSTLQDFNKDFYQLQHQLNHLKWLKNYRFLKYSHYKLSEISSLQNYLGILGYYNPFTVESNLNKYNTSIKQPSTLFHEYAHQMGFASESEANFIAYYLGSLSKNPEVNYAVFYKSIFSLLAAIYKSDPYFVKNEMNNLNEKIKRDREAEIQFYSKYEGGTSDVFSELNNQFLKANNQEGTISYSKYVELIYKLYN
ncbi:DUF3810 family protein [Chishuiella sp.]|uniref:DUF3810 family protein n=1 Tax=Chishuiella sp. TaxID=1969467 RepID=UPI0028AD7AC2|nr:DUF3810 family protein [Chishuiella sp.]